MDQLVKFHFNKIVNSVVDLIIILGSIISKFERGHAYVCGATYSFHNLDSFLFNWSLHKKDPTVIKDHGRKLKVALQMECNSFNGVLILDSRLMHNPASNKSLFRSQTTRTHHVQILLTIAFIVIIYFSYHGLEKVS